MTDVFVVFRKTCEALDGQGEASMEKLARNLAMLPYMRMRCEFNENAPEENEKKVREAIEMFPCDIEMAEGGKVRYRR